MACHAIGMFFLCLFFSVVSLSATIDVEAKERAVAEGKRALITGGAGFIGSHVAKHCLDLGMSVLVLDDLSGGFLSNIPKEATFIQGDLKDAALLERIFIEHRIHYVYHLGAYAAEGLSHFVRSFNYRTNLVGSVEILNQALKHGVECFVFTSSIAVYGTAKGGAATKGFTEETQPSPEDPYGIAKFAFEQDLQAAKRLFDMDFVIFRPHNVYGPHQNMFDKYRNVVGIFINQLSHEEPISIFGSGEQVRAFSFIEDVAPVISRGPLVPSARNQIFNVGGDKTYTINDLAAALKQALNKPPGWPTDHQPARMEVEVAIADHRKVREAFGISSATGLQEGLLRTVQWYQSQGKLFRPVHFETVEVKSRLPPSWARPDLEEATTCKGSRTGAAGGSAAAAEAEEEAFVEDGDLAFWLVAFREVNLVPGALRAVRSFHPRSPLLITVDKGGAVREFEEQCKTYGCAVRESSFWMGTPSSAGKKVAVHNFTCSNYMTWLAGAAAFFPSAKFIVLYEPDVRLLGRLRWPAVEADAYQFGNVANHFPEAMLQDLAPLENFPRGYSTAGGTVLKRSAVPAMQTALAPLAELLKKHPDTPPGQDVCVFMMLAQSKLRLVPSQDVLQSTESCSSSDGALHSCYSCIHGCKLREKCYQRDDWLSPVPRVLRSAFQKAYYAVAQPLCWVMSEPCSCPSAKAVRRADLCIRSCSYACPSLLHGVKGISKSWGTFVDCQVSSVHHASPSVCSMPWQLTFSHDTNDFILTVCVRNRGSGPLGIPKAPRNI